MPVIKCCNNCVHSRRMYYDNYVGGDLKPQKVMTNLYMCISEMHVCFSEWCCDNYLCDIDLPF